MKIIVAFFILFLSLLSLDAKSETLEEDKEVSKVIVEVEEKEEDLEYHCDSISATNGDLEDCLGGF